MERIIASLYDIEKEANIILERANEQKLELNKRLDSDIVDLEKKLEEDNTSKLNEIKMIYDKELEQEKAALNEQCLSQIKLMEQNYSQNHDKIVNDIFARIVS